MASDVRAVQARQHHRAALKALGDAASHRETRDELIRALRRDEPETWTYAALAKAVGCSPELIAVIIKDRQRT